MEVVGYYSSLGRFLGSGSRSISQIVWNPYIKPTATVGSGKWLSWPKKWKCDVVIWLVQLQAVAGELS